MRAGSWFTACPTKNGRRNTSARRVRSSAPHSTRRATSIEAVDGFPRGLTGGRFPPKREHAASEAVFAPREGTSMTDAAPAAETRSAAPARIAKEHLRAFVERIERLEEEKKTISDDIRDVYAEAKGNGFDVKALRSIVKLRKEDADERKEHEAILATYMLALGMIEA